MKNKHKIVAKLLSADSVGSPICEDSVSLRSRIGSKHLQKISDLMNSYLVILNGHCVHQKLLLPDKFAPHCIRENITVVGSY